MCVSAVFSTGASGLLVASTLDLKKKTNKPTPLIWGSRRIRGCDNVVGWSRPLRRLYISHFQCALALVVMRVSLPRHHTGPPVYIHLGFQDPLFALSWQRCFNEAPLFGENYVLCGKI